MLRRKILALLLLVLLLLPLVSIPGFADDSPDEENEEDNEFENDEEMTEEELEAEKRGYSVSLDEEDHCLVVIIHPSKLAEKPVDLSYAFAKAAEANALLDISSQKINLLFDKKAVQEIASSGEIPYLYMRGPILYAPSEETGAEETPKQDVEDYALPPQGLVDGDYYCLIHFIGGTMERGFVKVTINHRPEDSEKIRVFRVTGDESVEIDGKCKDRQIKLRVKELSHLIITEREQPGGDYLIKLLWAVLILLLILTPVASVMLYRMGKRYKAS